MLLIAALLFSYCGNSIQYENDFKKVGAKATNIFKYKIDSVQINIKNNSGDYFIKIIDSNIFVVDKIFGLIKVYDKNGVFLYKMLGKKEFPQLGELYSFSFYKGFYYISDNTQFYKFDNKFNLVKNGYIKFKPNILDFDSDKPNPNQIMFYQLNYNAMNGFNGINGTLIIPIEMELPVLNAFNNNDYYKKVYNFALIDTSEFKVKRLFNNWSNPYIQSKNYPFLTNNSYYISNNKVFINHEADSLIYVLDEKLQPLYKFGFKPKGLNNKYRPTKRLSEAFDPTLYSSFRKKYGYHKNIIVNDDVILRTYNFGGMNYTSKEVSGIQVYINYNLIKEITFSNEINLIGVINSQYYFHNTDIDDSSQLKIYKLKI